MEKSSNKQTGFTIVELLIVIVVIGILAAITIVAYNGIQGRSKDAKRQSDLSAIQKGLELYYVDNGGYPTCGGGTYQPGGALDGNPVLTCLALLFPKYLSPGIKDPLNAGSYQYYYAVGYHKLTSNSYSADQTGNYILGAKLETSTAPQYGGWGPSDLNYLGGSSR